MNRFIVIIIMLFVFVSSSFSADTSKESIQKAAHDFVKEDCQCKITEWKSLTFKKVRTELNLEYTIWEVMERFSSKRSDISSTPVELLYWMKIKYDYETKEFELVEIDYY